MNVSITTRYATEVIIKQKKGKQAVMHAVRVYRSQPTPKLFACLKATQMKMKYPWREKRYYPVKWPAQTVSRENGRVALPMGNGRKSLVLPLELPENSGACTLVWNNGFELHVCVEVPQAETTPGGNHATVDLGEIHLAAVTTNTGRALIVTGRGIRSLNKVCKRSLRRVRDVRHNAIRQVIDFCTSSVVESAAQPLLARSAEPPNKK